LVVAKPSKRLGRKEPNIIIIGADYHPGFQQIAFLDTDTGEFQERRLQHREEAEKFCCGTDNKTWWFVITPPYPVIPGDEDRRVLSIHLGGFSMAITASSIRSSTLSHR
jgi:hypothetical protein